MNKSSFYKLYLSGSMTLLLLCCTVFFFNPSAKGQQPSADLDQARNGAPGAPISPINWVNGNAGAQNSHYIEGHAIPYRTVMTNLPTDGTVVTIEIEYDTKHGGKHAIEFITQYEHLDPHLPVFGHSDETVNPRLGYEAVVPAVPNTWPIPVPPTTNTPVPGQPAAAFNALPAGERVMTLFGGTFSGANPIVYVTSEDLQLADASCSFSVSFIPTSSTAILAWAGHIATQDTWGKGQSAVNISGSPYHTRLLDWNLTNLGNQDRSLNADAVYFLPFCDFSGPGALCKNSVGAYAVLYDSTAYSYAWSITQNGTNAFFVGGVNNTASVQINSGSLPGSFTVSVTVSLADNGFPMSNTCSTIVAVNAGPACDIIGSDPVCPGSTQTYSGPAGLNSYSWSISGNATISGAANGQTVTVNAGSTCPGSFTLSLTTTDGSGCSSTCQKAVVIGDAVPPTITGVGGPQTIQCPASPVFSTPSASDLCDASPSLTFVDSTVPGTCPQEYIRTRTWTATDDCGNSSTASQTITVEDNTAPSITGVGGPLTIDCGTEMIFSDPSFSDLCDANPSISFEDLNVPGDCAQEYSITRIWTVTDACGNSSTASQTISVVDNSAPVLDNLPVDVIAGCNEDVTIPFPTVAPSEACDGNVVVNFSRSDNGDWGDPFEPGTTTQICFWAADGCGNVSDNYCIDVTLEICGDEHCTLTQGAYGSDGGTFCNGMGTVELLESLLVTDLVVGLNSNTLTFTSGDSQCIIDLLPGSGPAKKITGANTCASHPGIQMKNGRIYNILLAQTITLGLNLRLDYDLGSLAILSDTLVTAESSGCDEEGDIVISGYTKYAIPQSVYNVLSLNGTLTVYGLYNLANTGLGGGSIGATTLSAISDAVDAINRGFDECRIGGFQEALKSGAANSPGINNGKDNTDLDAVSLNSYPNPFKSSTNISFSIPASGHVKVDIYSLTGVKVATIFDNYADADQVYKIEFNGQSQINQATYICVISTESGTKYQRIMMVR